jgi:hypothetical protein
MITLRAIDLLTGTVTYACVRVRARVSSDSRELPGTRKQAPDSING